MELKRGTAPIDELGDLDVVAVEVVQRELAFGSCFVLRIVAGGGQHPAASVVLVLHQAERVQTGWGQSSAAL